MPREDASRRPHLSIGEINTCFIMRSSET